MAEYNWLTDDDEDEAPRGNDALKEARKAAKENAKARKDLEEQVRLLNAKVREREISDAIKEKGLDPKFAKWASKLDDTEFAEFINDLAPAESGSGSQETPDQTQVDRQVANETLDPNFQALARIQDRQAQAPAATGGEAEMLSKIAAASSAEELNQLLFGNSAGPQVY